MNQTVQNWFCSLVSGGVMSCLYWGFNVSWTSLSCWKGKWNQL